MKRCLIISGLLLLLFNLAGLGPQGSSFLPGACLPAAVSPIPNQGRGMSSSCLSSSLVGAGIWHLGISSGGIPS